MGTLKQQERKKISAQSAIAFTPAIVSLIFSTYLQYGSEAQSTTLPYTSFHVGIFTSSGVDLIRTPHLCHSHMLNPVMCVQCSLPCSCEWQQGLTSQGDFQCSLELFYRCIKMEENASLSKLLKGLMEVAGSVFYHSSEMGLFKMAVLTFKNCLQCSFMTRT